jgi:type III pantothenate kinase
MNPRLKHRAVLIDVGNSNVKWTTTDGRKLGRVAEFPTEKLVNRKSQLDFQLPGIREGICVAVISSVVPAATEALRKLLKKTFGIPSFHVVNHRSNLGIGIRYPKPQKIGADRLVNVVAAVRLYGTPAIVVDFGTAVTFDVISPDAEYLGGVIAPGIQVMTDYLYEKTALLPRITLKEPRSPVGKSTEEAMRVGAVIGYRGLIREVIRSIADELHLSIPVTPPTPRGSRNRLRVIATGSYSRLVTRGMREVHHVDDALTLHGLRLLLIPLPERGHGG